MAQKLAENKAQEDKEKKGPVDEKSMKLQKEKEANNPKEAKEKETKDNSNNGLRFKK